MRAALVASVGHNSRRLQAKISVPKRHMVVGCFAPIRWMYSLGNLAEGSYSAFMVKGFRQW
jgi:hypothetical protein